MLLPRFHIPAGLRLLTLRHLPEAALFLERLRAVNLEHLPLH
jgi:hypothetical protein